MSQYFNQHSFSLVAIVVWGTIGIILLRKGPETWRIIIVAAIAVIFITVWSLSKPEASSLDHAGDPSALIGFGKPVLLELQSPY